MNREYLCRAGYRLRKYAIRNGSSLSNADWKTYSIFTVLENMPIGSQAMDQTAIYRTRLPLSLSAHRENGTESIE